MALALPAFASFDLHTRLSKTMEADRTKGTTFSPGPGYEATSKSSMVHTTTIAPGSGIAASSVVMQEQGLRFTVAAKCSAVVEASPIRLGLMSKAA